MKPWVYIFLVFGLFGQLQAQQWSDDEVRERLNLGLKLGLGLGSFYGKELKHPTPMMGFQAGVFMHGKDTNSRLNWQTGLDARFRGSNFNNGDSGNTAYTKIALITIDVPMLLNIRTGKVRSGNYNAVQLGITASYILKSMVYVGEDKTPAQQNNYLKTWSKLPLKPIDYQLVVGFQHRGQVSGYQINFKYSLFNLNNNFKLEGMLPATGTGKFIGTFSLDFGFLF
jgi:hypothetical protein